MEIGLKDRQAGLIFGGRLQAKRELIFELASQQPAYI